MRTPLRAGHAAVAALLAALAACSTIDRLNAPPLEGAPETSALALVRVEASVRGFDNSPATQVLSGGTLQRVSDGRGFESKAVAGYLVFSGLAPGAYRLTILRTTLNYPNYGGNHLYSVPLDSSLAYDLELRAGQPCFLGVIAVEDVLTRGERGIYFAIRDRERAAAAAWKWFAALYASSPWAEVVRRAPSAACSRR